MYRVAKFRAKKKSLPFNLDVSDINIPFFCPVLGIELKSIYGKGLTDRSPSLDRIIPSLGYVKGNVIVISNLANRIKSNASPDQILKVAQFYINLHNKENQ